MKKVLVILTFGSALATGFSSAQGFVNLNFESASIAYTTNSSGQTGYSASAELPDWSVFAGGSPVTFFPNIGDSPSVALVYSNSAYVPSGNFAVWLQYNGEFGFGYPSGPGSISQAGLVPADAETLFFDVARAVGSGLSVSLSGQTLSCVSVGNFVNSGGLEYTVYGADIAAFAGQDETLAFSAISGDGVLDDIQFSTMIVPEPPAISLILLSSGILIYARYRFRRRPYG